MTIWLEHGDMRDVLPRLLAEEAQVDAIATDPPYHLTNRTPDVKWCAACHRVLGGRDGKPAACPACGGPLKYQRLQGGRGFMGQQWDGGDLAFQPETWRLCYDLLPPGGHLLAFSGTRTYHRMACAIEDAGFEIRDMVAWLYGQGFPKSLDVSKAIDKAAGAARAVVGSEKVRDIRNGHGRALGEGIHASGRDGPIYMERLLTAPATDDARQWDGWGTALKPALEPICVARKPLDGTVAGNILKHSTGALNIDGCRIEGAKPDTTRGAGDQNGMFSPINGQGRIIDDGRGRWPANVCHDGSDEVVNGFPNSSGGHHPRARGKGGIGQNGHSGQSALDERFDQESGSASRFFYQAKANKKDRLHFDHPTVKPIALLRWLVRLITPPGGVVLDPFAGTGTMGAACEAEGFDCILVERESKYAGFIRERLPSAQVTVHG